MRTGFGRRQTQPAVDDQDTDTDRRDRDRVRNQRFRGDSKSEPPAEAATAAAGCAATVTSRRRSGGWQGFRTRGHETEPAFKTVEIWRPGRPQSRQGTAIATASGANRNRDRGKREDEAIRRNGMRNAEGRQETPRARQAAPFGGQAASRDGASGQSGQARPRQKERAGRIPIRPSRRWPA